MVTIIIVGLIIAFVVAMLVIKKTPGPTKQEIDPNSTLRPVPPPNNGSAGSSHAGNP